MNGRQVRCRARNKVGEYSCAYPATLLQYASPWGSDALQAARNRWSCRNTKDSHETKRVLPHTSAHMSIESYTNGPVVIVTPQGRLDTNSAPEVEKVLTDHIERGEKKIVLDLSGLEYISSIGLRVILKTAMAMTRNGGRMALSGGNDQILQVLQLSGAMTMSLHTPALEDALAKIQA